MYDVRRSIEVQSLSPVVAEAFKLMKANNATRRALMACLDSALDKCDIEAGLRRVVVLHLDAAVEGYLSDHTRMKIKRMPQG